MYKADPLQKNNQGGIGSFNKTKTVYVYKASTFGRCPVRLYKKYISLLPPPKSCQKLYLRPRMKPTPSLWFCDQPLGSNKVSTTVKNLCSKAGFVGKYTNHSTSASRMYQSHVPEQIIKEITGHRSDCVRTYKRTSDEIRMEASNKISGEIPEKVEKNVTSNDKDIAEKHEVKNESIDECMTVGQKKRLAQSLTACQIIKNVVRTRMEMRKKGKSNLQCVRKIAKKLVDKQRKKKAFVRPRSKQRNQLSRIWS